MAMLFFLIELASSDNYEPDDYEQPLLLTNTMPTTTPCDTK